MKSRRNPGALFATLAASAALAAFFAAFPPAGAGGAQEPDPAATAKTLAPRKYYGKIAKRALATLQRYHVRQRPLDEENYRQAWSNLVSYYDFDHSVFLASDLEALAPRREMIAAELARGDVSFGYDVYSLYCTRLRERIDFATNLLATAQWDFSKDETYRIKRKDAPWPETREAAEEHWRKRLKNEMLAMTLSKELDAEKKAAKAAKKAAAGKTEKDGGKDEAGKQADKKNETPAESLIKKYRQYYIALTEPDEEAVLQAYLSAICHSCDPHTDYMSPMTKEEFGIEMSLSLSGVGAELTMEDGALKISHVMPGGPIDVDGRIKAGDKIVGVRQEGGEMEDITWRPMKKSIRKIRGKKGTKVALEIVPRDDTAGTTRKIVELVRDEIKLEEQAATGHVETVECGGAKLKVGYVYLPAFYGTMDKRPGEPGFLSCAADVGRYVASFNAQGAEAMILDLRGNGGGSLREAVALSALFVQDGPVVVVRDANAAMPLPIPRGNPVAFDKPLVVLIDRASASASEIVAAHLRDTGRAIVLGDVRSHGKGTVQSVMGMGPEKYGSIKVTTARFYRINGRSTQVEGVEADIHLPSILDSLDIGEDKLPNALPFTKLKPQNFRKAWNLDTYIPQLAELSERRTKADAAFARHVADVAATKAIFEREEVPLEREARKKLMKADRETAERSAGPDGDGDDEDGDGGDSAAPRRRRGRKFSLERDVVLKEAFNIVADLVRLAGGARMPRHEPLEWYNTILGF